MNLLPSPKFFDREGNPTAAEKSEFWKCGSVFGILSSDALSNFKSIPKWILKSIPDSKGIIFQDLYTSFLDWKKIRQADLLIEGWNSPLILGHITLGNENSSLNPSAKRPIASDVEAYGKLTGQLNAEFFLRLALILDNRDASFLKTLQPESTAEYALEGVLETFHHELSSPLLKERLNRIKGLKLSLFSALATHIDSFSDEKELIVERQALEDNLSSLIEIANQVLDVMSHMNNHEEIQASFSSFQILATQGNWEEKEEALHRFAKLFSLHIILIGNPLLPEVQATISLLGDRVTGS